MCAGAKQRGPKRIPVRKQKLASLFRNASPRIDTGVKQFPAVRGDLTLAGDDFGVSIQKHLAMART